MCVCVCAESLSGVTQEGFSASDLARLWPSHTAVTRFGAPGEIGPHAL